MESYANVRLSLGVVMIQIYLNWFECECSVDDQFLIDFHLCSTDWEGSWNAESSTAAQDNVSISNVCQKRSAVLDRCQPHSCRSSYSSKLLYSTWLAQKYLNCLISFLQGINCDASRLINPLGIKPDKPYTVNPKKETLSVYLLVSKQCFSH